MGGWKGRWEGGYGGEEGRGEGEEGEDEGRGEGARVGTAKRRGRGGLGGWDEVARGEEVEPQRLASKFINERELTEGRGYPSILWLGFGYAFHFNQRAISESAAHSSASPIFRAYNHRTGRKRQKVNSAKYMGRICGCVDGCRSALGRRQRRDENK